VLLLLFPFRPPGHCRMRTCAPGHRRGAPSAPLERAANERRTEALQQAVPGIGLGTACVVAGGLVAAGTSVTPSEHGSWLGAYLVLLAGVAQVALAVGQALLAPRPLSSRALVTELIAWNTGSAAVAGGTLAGLALLVDIGGALLLLTLTLLVRAVRDNDRTHRWAMLAYRLLVLGLVVSIPIGLWLARVPGH
jgi:hypothetical protein